MLHTFEIAADLKNLPCQKKFCCVAVPVCLDLQQQRHLLATVPQYEKFLFQGELATGMASYSLMKVVVQTPEGTLPVVCSDSDSLIFSHQACTWDGTRNVIELCCGMGALGHGASASGFKTVVGCDIRPKMLELFSKHSTGIPVLGDICQFKTLGDIYEAHPYSSVIASGIACQPYSQLGDQRGGFDPRASTLPATLAAAFYLRSMLVVIECVGPAQKDPFVQHHIRNFCSKTGFYKTECVQDLKEIWGSRRNRWWCVLSAPAIGPVEMSECGGFPDLSTVGSIIPKLRPWPNQAEEELELTPIEAQAFQPGGIVGNNFMLNTKAPMPCALHCWGSQLHPCPCGCRDVGLSKSRLDTKGLFAVLVEGASTQKVRHIHPQEAGALCGLDPCLTWGKQNRLSLGAVGQLASPLQALWVFSHILRKLQLAQCQTAEASPSKMMMAYRSWLLARCVKQWGSDSCVFPSSETLEKSRSWQHVVDLSFHELKIAMHEPNRDNHVQHFWDRVNTPLASQVPNPVKNHEAVDDAGTSECPTEDIASIGEKCDHGLSISQVAISTPSLENESPGDQIVSGDLPTSVEHAVSDEPSPVSGNSVSASLKEDIHFAIHGTGGEIDLFGGETRAHFRFAPGCTIEELLLAESDLQRSDPSGWEVFDVSPGCSDDKSLDGTLHQLSVKEQLRSGMRCKISVGSSASETEALFNGTCKRQKSAQSVSNQSHDSPAEGGAHPLCRLQGKQFLTIMQPVVRDFVHACSLLSQQCPSHIRIQVLSKQAEVWADDEVRWHLARIQSSAKRQCVIPIDPLLVHGCFESSNFEAIRLWLETRDELAGVYITAVLQNDHWYPLCMECRKGVLSASTWDIPNVEHHGLREFCHSFAAALTVKSGPLIQHSRLFAGDALCGAASLAYLDHKILGTQLPEVRPDLECLHQFYRQTLIRVLEDEARVQLPWLWGSGGDSTELAVSKLTPLLIQHGVPSDFAHGRATSAVKAIGATDLLKAMDGRNPWRNVKTLGTNIKFQFILPEELQAQISSRADKEAVGKPVKTKKGQTYDNTDSVSLDPTKLAIPPGSFVGGGKEMSQIPLSMLGPLSEGIVIATWSHAEPYLRASQQLAKGPLAMLVLNSPVGGCATSLVNSKVTVPARCSINNEPLLLEAILVQLGGVQITRAISATPVAIDSVKVSTIKVVVYKDECWQAWEEVTAAPMRYIIYHIPLLKLCKKSGCTCQHWHNSEKVEATETIVDVWRRQFLRAGYKPEPIATSTIFSVCIRVPECLTERLLGCSGGAGIYTEPRSLDSKSVSSDYEVVWVPKAGQSEVCHLRQVNPAVIGIARVNNRYGLRVRSAQAAELHRAIRPDAVYLCQGPRQNFMVGPIPYGTDRKALSKALSLSAWDAKPLQPVSALTGERGVMWSVIAVSEPPTNIISMSHGDVVITKPKEFAQELAQRMRPVAAPSTLSLCESGSTNGKDDPWLKADPWSQYRPATGPSHQQSGLTAAAESIHQLESKIESAVLAKIPQVVAMDQDDVNDRVQELESKFNQLAHRQQQLETVVNEQGAQQSAQLGQMQSQLNAHGQQLAGHMETQQHHLQTMFESQMAQIRGLLSKRPRDGDHE